MELFHNPDLMPEEEIKATFVARQRLIDELVSIVEHQPHGAGVQHLIMIGPRGMGKTTMLLMIRFAIQDRGLGSDWQVVKFPEESYGIYDLADLWMEILNHLAAETDDAELQERAVDVRGQYANTDDLKEAALALIKDWRRKHNKRLVVLVDNFDMILEQINDERDNARLRDVLMNDDTLMLIGCAVSFFYEARAYDQPLYNFFKIYNLYSLNFEQMQELLLRRAELDGIEDFEETLKANTSRLRALEYFTGGNPRLVLMLYRVITHSDISEVRHGLEKLLDEVTPYYKSKVESLPPQLRKIVDYIARVSGKTSEGLTPTDIAGGTRLSTNQVSAQLKRLSEFGYVRASNLRGRSSYYTLSEPLYAIWHQMRVGREARQRMQWFVTLLKSLYDAEEMGTEIKRLGTRFSEYLGAGRLRDARDALEHRRLFSEALSEIMGNLQAEALIEAIGVSYIRASTIEAIIRSYAKDSCKLIKELLTATKLEDLSDDILSVLHKGGVITEQEIRYAKDSKIPSAQSHHRLKLTTTVELSITALLAGATDNVLQCVDQALEINPDLYGLWITRGVALYQLGRYEEAVANFDCALQIKPSLQKAWLERGFGVREQPVISSITHPELSAIDKSGAELLDRCANRPPDENAWEEFVKRYHSTIRMAVIRASRRELRKQADPSPPFSGDVADDLVQATYVKVVEDRRAALKRFEDLQVKSVYQYLTALASNAVRDFFSKMREELSLKTDYSTDRVASDIHGSPIAEHRPGISIDEIEWALRRAVSGRRRERDTLIFKLRYYEGLTLDEIVKALNLDISAIGVGSIVNRIIKRIKPLLTSDDPEKWYDPITVSIIRFIRLVFEEKYDLARHEWKNALNFANGPEKDSWHKAASDALLIVAQSAHLKFVRQLIAESELDQQFFPLGRAIDYLLTGDEVLIEKLSPEVRGIVEEMVSKLRGASERLAQPDNKTTTGRTLSSNKSRGSRSKVTARRTSTSRLP